MNVSEPHSLANNRLVHAGHLFFIVEEVVLAHAYNFEGVAPVRILHYLAPVQRNMHNSTGLLLLNLSEVRVFPQEGVSSRQEFMIDDVVHTCSERNSWNFLKEIFCH